MKKLYRMIQKCGDRDKKGSYSIHDYSNTIPSNAMSDRVQLVLEIILEDSSNGDK